MEWIESVFAWAIVRFDAIYKWIGLQVIPLWNRLAYSHDMLLLVGSFLILALAIRLIFVEDPYWRRHRDKQYEWLDCDNGWVAYYKMFIKAFYYPMLVYFFFTNSPFTSISFIAPEETFFFQYTSLDELSQLVLALLFLRFAGVSLSFAVRLRVYALFRFWIQTLGCIILGTYLNGILLFLKGLAETNIILLVPVLIIQFIATTIPVVYFWIAMFLPLYLFVAPILFLPFLIIGGIANAMNEDNKSFLEWVKENHFFSYFLFFLWD